MIKWPNDVVVGGRKLAGILVESRLSGDRVDVAAAGVGFNVQLEPRDLPPSVASRAASLHELVYETPSRSAVLGTFLTALAPVLDQLGADNSNDLVRSATELSAVIGSEVHIRLSDQQSLSGRASRLTPDGGLILSTSDGEVRLGVGEIEQVRGR